MEEKQFDPNNPYDKAIREILAIFEGKTLKFAESALQEVKEKIRKDFILQKPVS